MSVRVRSLRATRDLDWSFRAAPAFHLGRQRTSAIDPFPAYGHDRRLVEYTAARLDGAMPIAWPVTFWIGDREEETRTNGWSQYDVDRVGETWLIVAGHVFLAGKRIPPHPAVTRYLVAHEYGHHVEWWLEHVMGLERDSMQQEYVKMRGLRKPRSYGGHWHRTPGEVFADDFRVLVGRVEEEFWPHPGVERPERLVHVRRWWKERLVEAGRSGDEPA